VAGVCRREPGRLIAGRPSSFVPRRRWGLPGSWTDPCVHARLSDPGEILTPGHCGVSMLPARERTVPALPTSRLSRLHRAAHTLAVYASWGGSPTLHARLAPGWWPAFAGRDSHPLGPHLKVSGDSYVIPPPSSGLPGATFRTTRPRVVSRQVDDPRTGRAERRAREVRSERRGRGGTDADLGHGCRHHATRITDPRFRTRRARRREAELRSRAYRGGLASIRATIRATSASTRPARATRVPHHSSEAPRGEGAASGARLAVASIRS
jgi:hypothetical protein